MIRIYLPIHNLIIDSNNKDNTWSFMQFSKQPNPRFHMWSITPSAFRTGISHMTPSLNTTCSCCPKLLYQFHNCFYKTMAAFQGGGEWEYHTAEWLQLIEDHYWAHCLKINKWKKHHFLINEMITKSNNVIFKTYFKN